MEQQVVRSTYLCIQALHVGLGNIKYFKLRRHMNSGLDAKS